MAAVPNQEGQPRLEEILKGIGDLAALPQVVYKIVELTGSTMTAAQEIERVISVDPGFSTKILMLANSAYYALPRKLTSISEAVTMLGFRTVRQLAMTIGVFEMFIGKNDASSLRRRAWWRHSVDTALCAQALAKLTGAIAPDEAYTCGLLHDIGKPLLDRYADASYDDVDVLVEAGMAPLRAEVRVFGCHHAELGGAAADAWGFPEDLSGCIGDHHVEAPTSPNSRLAIVVLANEMAKRIVAGSGPEPESAENQEFRSYPEWATSLLGLDEARLVVASRACAEAIASKSAMGAF
jgi:putative nucleotidyltransferase with HDIG domain